MLKEMREEALAGKHYAHLLLGKMHRWMIRLAFKNWMEGGNTMKIEQCIETQNALTEEMTVRNNELGNLTKRLADKTAKNDALTNKLKKMGGNSMSNAFARTIYTRWQRAFEQWKEHTRAHKHREQIYRRTFDHWGARNR